MTTLPDARPPLAVEDDIPYDTCRIAMDAMAAAVWFVLVPAADTQVTFEYCLHFLIVFHARSCPQRLQIASNPPRAVECRARSALPAAYTAGARA